MTPEQAEAADAAYYAATIEYNPCDRCILEKKRCIGIGSHCYINEHCTAVWADCAAELGGGSHPATCCTCKVDVDQ